MRSIGSTREPRMRGGAAWRRGVLLIVMGLSLALPQAARAAPPPAPEPLTFTSDDGEHKIKLSFESRYRSEYWDAHASDHDWFTAFRSRATLNYGFRDGLVKGLVQFQDARINGLSSRSSGAGALYYRFAGNNSQTHGDRVRQLWLELNPIEGLGIRAGRQDIKLGTEVMYPEPNWKYLKIARGSQRLVGTVGWTHAERTNDGVSLNYDMGDYNAFAWGAKPTTGVFDIDGSYSSQTDILYGGLSLTAKRGVWMDNTEFRAFGIAYRDDRNTDDGGLSDSGNIDAYTVGFSSIGIHPMGDGNFDILVWGAYQFGDWYSLTLRAWAGLFELGYQFTEADMKPWIRIGVNVASGDGSATDSDHEAFFNVLPTNHLYYGWSDQFALSNLIDMFAQLKLTPFAKTDVNMFLHRFQVFTGDDGRWFGTGAFAKSNLPGGFGYGVSPSQSSGGAGSHHSVGTAAEIVVNYNVNQFLSLQGGYSYMWGNALFNSQYTDDDVRFGYVQVTVKYP
jgi:hypothetical protein